MKPRFFTSDRPLVFAHRGGSALAPENTIAAFDHGLALGADGLELDVHLSRDGVPVVHHDPTLDRTTNRRGPIADHTAAELARADAGWHFRRGDEFPFRGGGIGVPTLSEVLARYSVPLIVELKSPSATLAEAVVAAIRAAAAVERVCVGAFELGGLRVVRRLEPAIATSAARVEVGWALLRLACRCRLARTPAYACFQVPERSGRTRVVSPRFVAAAHRAGLGVQVWTVDAPEQATRLLDCGVDALTTDRPDTIVPLCRRRGI